METFTPHPPPPFSLSPLPFERTPLINLGLFIYLFARPLQSKNDTMGRVKQQSDAPIGPSTVFSFLTLGEVRIPRRTAARAHFVVINKGAGQFFLSSDTR